MTSTSSNPAVDQTFVRDRLAWMSYLLIGNFCFSISSLGPLMPFLRSELGLTYTVAAYHFSAWALGSLTAGSIGERVIDRFGKRVSIWLCGCLYCVGLGIFLVSHSAWITVPSVFIAGLNASLLGQSCNTMNAERFGRERVIAMTETNISAAIFSSIAPATISFFVKVGVGWRLALLLPIVEFLFLMLLFFRTPVPNDHRSIAMKKLHGSLPMVYWGYWTVILFTVACEWSIGFWSADFLEKVVKLPKADASQAVAVFLCGILIGRVVGSRLSRSVPTSAMLIGAAAILFPGFLVFWLARVAALNVAGLFVAGLGMANFYPLLLSAAVGTVPERAALATARVSVGTGSAILIAPLVLGIAADHVGIFNAYGIVAVLMSLAIILIFVANGLAARHEKSLQTIHDS